MKQIIKSASKAEPIYISTQAERTVQERTHFSLFIHSPGAARQQRRLPSNLHDTLRSALPFFFLRRGGANACPRPITEQMLVTVALKWNSDRTLKMHMRRTSCSWNGFGEKGNPAVTSATGGGGSHWYRGNPSLTCRPASRSAAEPHKALLEPSSTGGAIR